MDVDPQQQHAAHMAQQQAHQEQQAAQAAHQAQQAAAQAAHQAQQEAAAQAAHQAQQIATLQQQVAALMQQQQQQPQQAVPAVYPDGKLIAKPEKYNGDQKTSDWVSFRLQFERAVIANCWHDRQARFVLAASMTGMAALVTQDLDPNTHATLDALLNAYQERFLPLSSSSKAQCDFETAYQEPKEDVLTFHSRLRGLFIRAYPRDNINTSTNLIRRFCRGVRGEDLQIWLFRQNPSTYPEALSIAQSDQAAKDMVRYNRTQNFKGEPMDINAINPKCWNCDKPGHVAKDCRAPRKKKVNPTRNHLGNQKNFLARKTTNNNNNKTNPPKRKWRKINALIDLLAEEEDDERYQQILALLDDAEEEEEEEDAEDQEEHQTSNDPIEGAIESSSDFQ